MRARRGLPGAGGTRARGNAFAVPRVAGRRWRRRARGGGGSRLLPAAGAGVAALARRGRGIAGPGASSPLVSCPPHGRELLAELALVGAAGWGGCGAAAALCPFIARAGRGAVGRPGGGEGSGAALGPAHRGVPAGAGLECESGRSRSGCRRRPRSAGTCRVRGAPRERPRPERWSAGGSGPRAVTCLSPALGV